MQSVYSQIESIILKWIENEKNYNFFMLNCVKNATIEKKVALGV